MFFHGMEKKFPQHGKNSPEFPRHGNFRHEFSTAWKKHFPGVETPRLAGRGAGA
jgi:hypothetical protein